MKFVLVILVGVLLIGCKKEGDSETGSQPFFVFDRIDYYHTDVNRDDVIDIAKKHDKTRKEQALMQIVIQDIPVSAVDTLFIRNMDSLAFKKHHIKPVWNSRISDLFSLRTAKAPDAGRCMHVFRDILIFRNGRQVVGIAKIDFDCGKHQIVGSRYNPGGFGKSGEFRVLYKILKQNSIE